MTDILDMDQDAVDALEKQVEDLKKFKDDSTPQLEAYEKAKVELEDYNTKIKPNWDKTRKTIDNLKNVVKEKGVEVDDDGNIKNPGAVFDMEKIRAEAAESTRREILNSRLEELLGDYTKEDAEVVKYHYNKLSAGEKIDMQNIKTFVKQAEAVANVDAKNPVKAFTFSGGQGPRFETEAPNKLSDADRNAALIRMGKDNLIKK